MENKIWDIIEECRIGKLTTNEATDRVLILYNVVEPKETFICNICDEEMEVGEQCGYDEGSCPSYTGK